MNNTAKPYKFLRPHLYKFHRCSFKNPAPFKNPASLPDLNFFLNGSLLLIYFQDH